MLKLTISCTTPYEINYLKELAAENGYDFKVEFGFVNRLVEMTLPSTKLKEFKKEIQKNSYKIVSEIKTD